MLTVLIARGKKSRKLEVSGYVRESGIKCARVKNELGVVYFVKILPEGTSSCSKRMRGKKTGKIVEVECRGHHFGKCCHVDAVKCADLPTQEMVENGLEVNALLLKNKALYQAGEWTEQGDLTPMSAVVADQEIYNGFHNQDAYALLGAARKGTSAVAVAEASPESCRYCGRICKHGICGVCAS